MLNNNYGYDNDFIVQLNLTNQQESKLFEPDVAGAPVIAGSLKAITESAICYFFYLREWEINRSIDFSAENRVEIDEEVFEQSLARIVEDEKNELRHTLPDFEEIQDDLEKELAELLKKLQEIGKNYLQTMRNNTQQCITSISSSHGYDKLKIKMGVRSDAEFDRKMSGACSDLEAKAMQRQHPAFRKDNLNDRLNRVDAALSLGADIALVGYFASTNSSQAQNGGLPVATPVSWSNAPEATVTSVLTPRPEPTDVALLALEGAEIALIADDLHTVIVGSGNAPNEDDDPETADAAFRARLEMRFFQQRAFIAQGRACHEVESAMQEAAKNPAVSSKMQPKNSFAQIPTPKPQASKPTKP